MGGGCYGNYCTSDGHLFEEESFSYLTAHQTKGGRGKDGGATTRTHHNTGA